MPGRPRLLRRIVAPILAKGWWHWIRFVLLLLAGSWIGHLLSESPRFADIRYALYQKQTQMQHRGLVYPQHTVLVLLDDDDYWSERYGAREPVKLEPLAEMLDKLNASGANTVGIDFFLTSPRPEQPEYDFPEYAAGDAKMFAAIQRMCMAGRYVVLAALMTGEKGTYHQLPSIYSSRQQQLPCMRQGYVALPDDARKIPGTVKLDTGEYLDSFSLAMVRIKDPVAYDSLVKGDDRGFRFARYLTPQDYQPRSGIRFLYNGADIDRMSVPELHRAVADKTVLVGGSWSEIAKGAGEKSDMHASPGGEEPGTMLHANYVEAELNPASTFTPVSDHVAEVLEWLLAFGLALVAISGLPEAWKWGSIALCFLLSVALTYGLMQNLGLFLDFFVPFVMIVAHALTEEILDMRKELNHLKNLEKEHAK